MMEGFVKYGSDGWMDGWMKNADKGAGRTFSLAIVSMTSSGGVPSSSVMILNWFTSGKKIKDGRSCESSRKKGIDMGTRRETRRQAEGWVNPFYFHQEQRCYATEEKSKEIA